MSRYDRPRWANEDEVNVWRQIHGFPSGSSTDPVDLLDREDPRETDSQTRNRIAREMRQVAPGDEATLDRLNAELLAFEDRTCGVCRRTHSITAFWIPGICRAHIAERHSKK